MLHLFSNPIVNMVGCVIVFIWILYFIIKYRHKNHKNHFALPLLFVVEFSLVITFVLGFLTYLHPDEPYSKNPMYNLLVYGPIMSIIIAVLFTGVKIYRDIIPKEQKSYYKKALIFLAIVTLCAVILVALIEFKLI